MAISVYLVYDDSKPVSQCVRGAFSDMEDAIECVDEIARALPADNKRLIWTEKILVK